MPGATSDVHHSKGKLGAALFFFPWFKAVCRDCHTYIDANREWARTVGLLASPGKYNTKPPANVYVVKWKIGRKTERTYLTGESPPVWTHLHDHRVPQKHTIELVE